MAIVTAYSQTLPEDAATGTLAYCYIVPVPLSVGGAAFRPVIQGPYNGSNMWAVGHGQVTVNGNAAFSVAAGQTVEADPIVSAVSGSISFAFNIPASSTYKRRTTGTSLNYLYKQGTGANNGPNLAEYINIANATAVIKEVKVGDAADFTTTAPPPPPSTVITAGGTDHEWGIAAVAADQMYARGDFLPGVAGQYLHVNLCSQAASGKKVILWGIEVDPQADTPYSIRALMPQPGWESISAICNADFREAAPYATARLYKGWSASILGGAHSVGTLKRGETKMLHLPWATPLVRVWPGFVGACLVLHTTGIGADVTFHWQELA